ncbi:NADP-dependent oxidoreductase [Gammaproteobacteria bacterium]|nr:NADP-dependent oxidoreductase [Gammaproteobacteria bacterium]
MINRKWLLSKRPRNIALLDSFTWAEEEIKDINEGEFLVKNLYLSFDPAQYGWMEDKDSYVEPVKLGEVMRAISIAQVIETRNERFLKGDLLQGSFGWQEYAISDGKSGYMRPFRIPKDVPITAPLGILGNTGLTAYFGLTKIGKPTKGDTVLVSAAAGSTGSVVGQIAKIMGCRVIGTAGGIEKCQWLTQEAGFDAAIDYTTEDLNAALDEYCPNGINIVFDNVGGDFLSTSLLHIAEKARIVLCGAISSVGKDEASLKISNYMSLVIKRATMEGFISMDYIEEAPATLEKIKNWINEGRLIYREDVVEGLEHAPETLLRLYSGKNIGKQILKISDPL